MNRLVAYFMIILSTLIGGGSLLLFGAFLLAGPFTLIPFNAPESEALRWDGFLSLLFFTQHSVMIRAPFQDRLSGTIPRHYHPAVYSLASGLVLTMAVLFWQTSETVLFRMQGPLALLPRAISFLGIAGFIWGVRALKTFDTFGWMPILAHLRGRQLRPPRFVIRGPYSWIRHPLYFFMLVIIWSVPGMTSDRLLFNALWTLWIVLGSFLEEKDLVAAFGEEYRRYQKRVPMLLPWREPAGRGL